MIFSTSKFNKILTAIRITNSDVLRKTHFSDIKKMKSLGRKMKSDNTLIIAIVLVFLIFFFSGFGMMGFGGMSMMSGFYYGFGFFGWLFMILIVVLLVL